MIRNHFSGMQKARDRKRRYRATPLSTAPAHMAPDRLPASLEAASTIRVLASGELLFRQGDPAAAIYRVESGRLRLIRRTADDHLVILHTARRGEFFAEASLF